MHATNMTNMTNMQHMHDAPASCTNIN